MKKGYIVIVTLILSVEIGFGQITIVASGASGNQVNIGETYSQNFNGLISSGNDTYTDNSTIAGWYVNSEEMDSNADEYIAGTGSSTGGEVYSFGSSSASDRALGYLGSGGNDYFNLALYGSVLAFPHIWNTQNGRRAGRHYFSSKTTGFP